MTVVGVIRPREAGIECIGNGCGGLRMCDRDRSGAGLGLGVGGQSCPHSAPEHPSTPPDLASPQPTLRIGHGAPLPPTPLSSSQSRSGGVSFFVGDACKSVDKHTHTNQPTPKVMNSLDVAGAMQAQHRHHCNLSLSY